jgi:hypothetical protein
MTGAWIRAAGAVLALLLPHRLEGQDPISTDTVLARLTREAVGANAGLSAEQARAGAAAVRVKAAGALPDPMLNTGVMNLTLPGFNFHESDFTEVDIELSQEFPWPGTLGSRTRAADAEARMRGADVRSRRRDIVTRAAELYYRLRYVVAAQQVLARQRALLGIGVEISTTRYAIGSVGQTDPLQARVARARLDTEAAALRGEEAGLRADLKALRNVQGPDRLQVLPIVAESVYVALEGAGDVHHMIEEGVTRPCSGIHASRPARQPSRRPTQRRASRPWAHVRTSPSAHDMALVPSGPISFPRSLGSGCQFGPVANSTALRRPRGATPRPPGPRSQTRRRLSQPS